MAETRMPRSGVPVRRPATSRNSAASPSHSTLSHRTSSPSSTGGMPVRIVSGKYRGGRGVRGMSMPKLRARSVP